MTDMLYFKKRDIEVCSSCGDPAIYTVLYNNSMDYPYPKCSLCIYNYYSNDDDRMVILTIDEYLISTIMDN